MVSREEIVDILNDQTRVDGLFQTNPEGFTALMRNIIRVTGLNQLDDTTGNSGSEPQDTYERSTGKSEKHPDPPIFSGNPVKWREFKTQLRVKLHVNRDRYSTSQSRLAYTVSRLQNNPLNIVQPKITNGIIHFSDYEDLLSHLDIAYQDPDLMIKAQRELRDLKQKNREFYLYFADFQRIIEDTGITDNKARKNALIGGISSELLNLLIYHDVPALFEDLVKLLQNLDSRLRLSRSRVQDYRFNLKPPEIKLYRFNYENSISYLN